MPPTDDEDREGEKPAPPANDSQRLVRLPPRRRKPDPDEPEPEPAAPRKPDGPPPAAAAALLPQPPAAPMNNHAPTAPTNSAEGNVLFLFEEAVKVNPSVTESIFLSRKTGTPAQWMITTRPQTANQLYAAIKLLHGRSPEATYDVSFRDAAGHGSNGTVSLPSTLEELPAPPVATYPYAPAPYQPPPAYAQPAPQPYAPQPYVQPVAAALPPVAPPGAPIDALLAMQKQTLDMVQALQVARHAPSPQPPAVALPAPAPPPAQPAIDPLAMLLAAQRQTIEMIQAMQPAAAPAPPPLAPPPAVQPAPAPPVADPLAMLLAAQRQTIEMIQAMQPGGVSAPPSVAQPAPIAPTAAADPMGLMLAMQKQTLDMVLTIMQSAQRAAAPPSGPYRPLPRDPNDPNAPPYDPRDPRGYRPPYQPPPARPQTASEQLREAAGVFRDLRRAAREFGLDGAPAAAEPAPEREDDDNPVRVIPMGPARGVINKGDGTLRVAETIMANLPDAIGWVAKQREVLQKERDDRERRERERQAASLPPGFVLAGPDYKPPDGFVAVPVDQIPEHAQPAQATSAPLPEPPAEMPPPIDRPRQSWGMPPARGGGGS